jgi:hypothetical protein
MSDHPFTDLKPLPEEHFKLYFYAAVLHVVEQALLTFGSAEATFQPFPFLAAYHGELLSRGLEGATLTEKTRWWRDRVHEWEDSVPSRLPLVALRDHAGLAYYELILLFCSGLIDEDARFGHVFDALQGASGHHRPTTGLLHAWWREPGDVRAGLQRLEDLGLVQIANPEAPRPEKTAQPVSALWDVLRGQTSDTPFLSTRYKPAAALPELDNLIFPETMHSALEMIHGLFASCDVPAVIVRGAQRNGRRTALGAIAKRLGRGLLEVNASGKEHCYRSIGSLATLLHAVPVIVLDLAPGENVEIPLLYGLDGPLAVVLGKHGGVTGPIAQQSITLDIQMPQLPERRRHWIASLGPHPCPELEVISQSFRMTTGNIRRAAKLARSYASLANRQEVSSTDVQKASGSLSRHGLDTLAVVLPPFGDWSHLAAGEETLRALRHLESRCRNRERILAAVGATLSPQLNAGVRALLRGPSGTGKTLAARLLASALRKDLYRIDLSAVVNKYIGETEKSLNQIFSCAEELDVILLLDEGDALLTQRTSVHTSNDRYANLETNFLLQRLETFEGILLVTTNAGNRIDSAFQRRIDVVVDFRPPEAAERWTIWQLHLPDGHAVDPVLLREVASRCRLTGGQIRNAVVHASVLALDDGDVLNSGHLESGVLHEYSKTGSVCPLREAKMPARVGGS